MSGGLDPAVLGAWLRERGLAGAGVPRVEALAGGQSNPTYRVRTEGGDFVLRKRPPGQLLPSAHAIDREYRVMQALAGSDVPVPGMVAWCSDASVTGTEFYLMEFLDGRVFADPALPGADPAQRAAIYREMNRVIARLHSVDVQAAGLASFGRPGHYVARQVSRWVEQCRKATLPLPAAMRELMDWLPAHLPAESAQRLVHGDFRIDNLVFHPTEARVIGVLDWELSTLGDPLADFAYHCMRWHLPPPQGLAGADIAALGIPSEAPYLRRYLDRVGASREPSADEWTYHLVFNMFRLVGILQGVAARALQGNASSAQAIETGKRARPLAEQAWALAQDIGKG